MRPLSFTIEIPERPIYIPNSGPPMAPITLVPENEDTGWVIADTVDFRGISQYVIAPKDNPVHRRVVRKEDILIWVSAKAYEDYEYGLCKLHELEEEQRVARLLARAAELKARRWTQEQVKREARARARTAVLGQPGVEGSRKTTPVAYSSASDVDSEGPYKEFSVAQTSLAKRKRSLLHSGATEDPVKRRAVITLGPGLLQQRISQLFAGLPQRNLQSPTIANKDEEEGGDSSSEYGKSLSKIGSKPEESRPAYRPILPPPKPTSRSSSSSSTQIGTTSSSHVSTAALSGPSWNVSGSRRHPRVEIPNRFSSAEAQRLVSPSNSEEQPQVSQEGIYLPILPRPRSLKIRPSSTEVASSQKPLVATRKAHHPPNSPSGNRSQNMSANNFAPISAYVLAKGKGTSEIPKSTLSKALDAKHSSNKFSHRTEPMLTGNGNLEDLDGNSSLNESQYVRTTTQRNQNILKHTIRNSQAPVEQNSLSESSDDSESEDDAGGWQINGLLEDEMRLENGDLVQYYLVDWVGGWDPTWEPETNVSSTAIKAYLKKQANLSKKLDGPADEMSSNGSNNRRANASGTRTDGAQKGDAASDPGEVLAASSGAPIFLKPAKVSEFSASGFY